MADYASERAHLLATDREMGGFPQLSEEEMKADAVLENLKARFASRFELQQLLQFYGVAGAIRETQLYRVLVKMPKGAHLHIHSAGCVHPDFLRHEILTNPKVYFSPTERKFSVKHHEAEGYEPAGAYFSNHPEQALEFSNLLSLNPHTGTGTSAEVWKHFQHLFMAQHNVLCYNDIFQRFLIEVLDDMYQENVQRVEFRHMTRSLFTDEKVLSLEEEMQVLQRTVEQFQQTHSAFSAAFVLSGFKFLSPQQLQEQLVEFLQVAKNHPTVCLGYDLVGEEEKLRRLKDHAEVFSQMKRDAEAERLSLNFFFHAGETLNPRNENLADALALGTLRIAHGINLCNYPALLDEVKSRGVLVECCPLSNMLLRYVLDPRTHPAQGFLRRGVRVSISSDDPGMFGYKGVTEDFVYATVMWNLGLAELKKLVLNSIEGCTEPEETMRHWQPKWTEFVHYLGQLQVE